MVHLHQLVPVVSMPCRILQQVDQLPDALRLQQVRLVHLWGRKTTTDFVTCSKFCNPVQAEVVFNFSLRCCLLPPTYLDGFLRRDLRRGYVSQGQEDPTHRGFSQIGNGDTVSSSWKITP